MQFKQFTRSVAVLCCSFLFATVAFAQGLPQPNSMPVSLHGEALANAENKLVGSGIDLDGAQQKSRRLDGREPAKVASGCGADAEIVWREVRRSTDPEGGTHVFYRQFVAGGGIDAELTGSELVAHRTAEGRLIGITGDQFDSVTISGCAKLSAAKAAELARERVLIHKGEYAAHGLMPWSMMEERRAERLAETKLKLVQIDGTFRPAWYTIGDDAEGEPYAVVLDAENERLLSIGQANPGSNCAPTEPLSFASAYGQPVRPELVNWRGMKANAAPRAGGFTHEGVWMPSLPLLDQPLIRHIVYHGTTSSTYRCATGKNYTVFPLKVDTAFNCCSPVYVDVGTTWSGRAAGDALWNTYKTINTFRAMGRKGWDDLNGDARIVVMSGGQEFGQWIRTTTNTAPIYSVRIGAPLRMYNLAASLDLVAHEWGHGLIDKHAAFDYGTQQGAEFHEGWADVIGMLVEKRAQASGNGLEQSSDWVMHEDAAVVDPVTGQQTYARGAIDDDADGVPGHDWIGINDVYDINLGEFTRHYHFDDRLHRLDGVPNLDQPHATGNMLNVAYLIMAAGGSTTLPNGLNPICSRPNAQTTFGDSCAPTNAVTGYLGSTNAGALLFYAIQFTVTTGTTWDTVADRVIDAAFLRFNLCSSGSQHNAASAQDAVRKAFIGIGHPPQLYLTANRPCS